MDIAHKLYLGKGILDQLKFCRRILCKGGIYLIKNAKIFEKCLAVKIVLFIALSSSMMSCLVVLIYAWTKNNGCIDVFLQHVPQKDLVMTAERNVEIAIKSMLVTMLMVYVPMVAMKDLKDSYVKHVRLLYIKWYIGFYVTGKYFKM